MDFSLSEMLFLAVLALLIFGPQRLPDIARRIGRIVAELKRASSEFRNQLEAEAGAGEITKQRDYYRTRAEELSKQIQSGFATPEAAKPEPTVYESPYPATAPAPAAESEHLAAAVSHVAPAAEPVAEPASTHLAPVVSDVNTTLAADKAEAVEKNPTHTRDADV